MRNRLCYLRNYKAVCFNFLKTKPARALWTSGAKHPEYVFRSWGGSVAMDEIATGLTELWRQGVPELGI